MNVICKVESRDYSLSDHVVNRGLDNDAMLTFAPRNSYTALPENSFSASQSGLQFHLKKELAADGKQSRGGVKAKRGEDAISIEVELRRLEDEEVGDLERRLVEAERIYEEIKEKYVDKLLQVQSRRKNCCVKIPIVRRIDATETLEEVKMRESGERETERFVDDFEQDDDDGVDACNPFASSELSFMPVPDGDEPQPVPSLTSAVPHMGTPDKGQQQKEQQLQQQQQLQAQPQQQQLLLWKNRSLKQRLADKKRRQQQLKQTDNNGELDACNPFATLEVPFTAVPDSHKPQPVPSMVSAVPHLGTPEQPQQQQWRNNRRGQQQRKRAGLRKDREEREKRWKQQLEQPSHLESLFSASCPQARTLHSEASEGKQHKSEVEEAYRQPTEGFLASKRTEAYLASKAYWAQRRHYAGIPDRPRASLLRGIGARPR